MSKPSTKLEFATDGGALLTDPGAAKRHAGFNVDEAIPAHWLNWLLKNIGEWIEFLNLSGPTDELTYPMPRTRTVMVPLVATGDAASGGFAWNLTDSLQAIETAEPVATTKVHLPVPQGAMLTAVRCLMDQATSGPTTPMRMRVSRFTANNTTSSAESDAATDAHASAPGFEVLDVAPGGAVLAANQMWVARLSASSGAAGGTIDRVHWLEVTYTETRATGNF